MLMLMLMSLVRTRLNAPNVRQLNLTPRGESLNWLIKFHFIKCIDWSLWHIRQSMAGNLLESVVWPVRQTYIVQAIIFCMTAYGFLHTISLSCSRDDRVCMSNQVLFKQNTQFRTENTGSGLFCILRDNCKWHIIPVRCIMLHLLSICTRTFIKVHTTTVLLEFRDSKIFQEVVMCPILKL